MRSKIVIVVCIAILSLFIFMTHTTISPLGSSDEQLDRVENSQSNPKTFQLDDKPDHLFLFLQISDIHISIYRDEQRIQDFRQFATETLDTIKPAVVIASGDLTDAKDKDFLGSRQLENEWKIYNETLTLANVRSKTIWLDIRGNHDNFNVPAHMQDNTFFKRFSVQGPQHRRSYMEIVKGKSGEKYSFIAVDACLQPGPKRPFNFIGVLTQNDTDSIQQMLQESRQAGTNYTIWFGHYPTSCIIPMNNNSRGLTQIISENNNSLAYMCGHLHTLGGMVPQMYALQRNSFLELEVADWKACRKYRVAAIDHGLLSFVDVEHGTWPVILITNPKHSLFYIPHRQENRIQLESTHIRLLAFSPAGIKQCTVIIDNDFKTNCDYVSENLFVAKWDPQRYGEGMHTIKAIVIDNYDRKNEVTQPFRLDGSQTLTFASLAEFVLKTGTSTIFKYAFWLSLAMCVIPLIFFRIWHELVLGGKLSRKRSNCRTSMTCIQQYWVLSTIDRLFWPNVLYCIYLSFGPWSICEVIDEHYGAIFVWGIYIDGAYLPGALTYLYGFFQLTLCQFPLIWIYSRQVGQRYHEIVGLPAKKHRGWLCSLRKLANTPFYIIISIEIVLAILFEIYYGIIAFLISPFRTGSVIMNLILFYLAKNIPEHLLKPAIYVWNASDKPLNAEQNESTSETNKNHTK